MDSRCVEEPLQWPATKFNNFEQSLKLETSEREGNHIDAGDFLSTYMTDVIEKAGLPNRSVKVVIDSANAVPGPFMVELCEKLGCETVCTSL